MVEWWDCEFSAWYYQPYRDRISRAFEAAKVPVLDAFCEGAATASVRACRVHGFPLHTLITESHCRQLCRRGMRQPRQVQSQPAVPPCRAAAMLRSALPAAQRRPQQSRRQLQQETSPGRRRRAASGPEIRQHSSRPPVGSRMASGQASPIPTARQRSPALVQQVIALQQGRNRVPPAKEHKRPQPAQMHAAARAALQTAGCETRWRILRTQTRLQWATLVRLSCRQQRMQSCGTSRRGSRSCKQTRRRRPCSRAVQQPTAQPRQRVSLEMQGRRRKSRPTGNKDSMRRTQTPRWLLGRTRRIIEMPSYNEMYRASASWHVGCSCALDATPWCIILC